MAANRFGRQLSRAGSGRGYDNHLLPPGPLPVHARPVTARDFYARAKVRPEQIGDAVFQPIHNSQREWGRAGAPVANLGAGVNNYAWAGARRHPNYEYGNVNLPTPVNAQFYPTPAQATAVPVPRPFSVSTFAEVASQMSQRNSLPQPYRPDLVPSFVPSRDASADLLHSEYQTYSSAQWPSSIAPPAAYYLPPDVVI